MGTKQNGAQTFLARTLFCCDLLSNFILGAEIDDISTGEQTLFWRMLPSLPTSIKSILIMDRGFGNRGIVQSIEEKKGYFCIRLSIYSSGFAKRAMKESQTDYITEWSYSKREKETALKNGLGIESLKVRVTKVILNTGETELLVSNLYDTEEITAKDMKELYFHRWPVEEAIKKLKPKMKIEYWGCKKKEGVYQEFYAHIVMFNLIALLGGEAQQQIDVDCKGRKVPYIYNWQNAYRNVRSKMLELLSNINITKVVEELIERIRSSIVAVRKERTFERTKKGGDSKARLYAHYK